jgi:pilus assembly protein CpaB
MKNVKAIGLLVLASAIGLGAAVYAAGWVSKQGGVASNKVVVAASDIELGSKINVQMLSTVDWPSGSAPAGTQGGLSAVIAEGKRAMTVRVNDVVGVAGFALPGNYVDVMVNAQQDKNKGEEGKQISKTVLEHVLVLAVAQEAGRDDTKPRVVSAVTLELTLEDSEKLDLARSVGTLSLVLRNQVDKNTVSTAGITKNQLFGERVEPEAAPAKVAAVKPRVMRSKPMVASASQSQCVEVIQNGSRTLNCF